MRALLASCLLLAASACELEPAPKKAPVVAQVAPPVADPAAAPPPAVPTPVPAPPTAPPPGPPTPPPAGAGSGSDAPVSQPCLDVSGHIAQTLIAEAADPGQKAAMEQEKTKIIRRSAEACTRDNWKPEVMKCFLDSKNTEQMQICAKDLASP